MGYIDQSIVTLIQSHDYGVFYEGIGLRKVNVPFVYDIDFTAYSNTLVLDNYPIAVLIIPIHFYGDLKTFNKLYLYGIHLFPIYGVRIKAQVIVRGN